MNHLDELLLEDFRANVTCKSKDVDPNDEHDWFDLSYGYFLGRGRSIDESMTLALELMKRNAL